MGFWGGGQDVCKSMCCDGCVRFEKDTPFIAAHICASSWALGAPMQPISPHQTHSLGLSVEKQNKRNTQAK